MPTSAICFADMLKAWVQQLDKLGWFSFSLKVNSAHVTNLYLQRLNTIRLISFTLKVNSAHVANLYLQRLGTKFFFTIFIAGKKGVCKK